MVLKTARSSARSWRITAILIPQWIMIEILTPRKGFTMSLKPYRRTNQFDRLFHVTRWNRPTR